MIDRLSGTSPLAAFCVKCRTRDRNLGRTPRFAARAKSCGKWVAGCPNCFADNESARADVVAHVRARRGCGFCASCRVRGMIAPFLDRAGEINVDLGGKK